VSALSATPVPRPTGMRGGAEPPAPPIPDERLVAQVVAGDAAAFTQLVERYAPQVYALAYRKLRNAFEADEATQETFIRAYTHLGTYRPEEKFAAWLRAITVNWCISHWRRQTSRKTVSLELSSLSQHFPDTGNSLESVALRRERQQELAAWLAQLPAHYRQVVVLHYWHDLSYVEMSALLNLPVAAVRMRLYRARLMLKEHRGQFFPTECNAMGTVT
jgi:RNA polymerase sigma-70 factor (ECF subfamily)